jgi:NADPH:quinone reductase-like Zn-dependent oxidoreductase
MKAYALTSPDQPATLIDLPEPDLPADGVRIRVRAVSVNGFDVYQASGYLVSMMEHVFPTIIGRDFAGVVEAVGSGYGDFAAGDAVLGFITSTPPLHDGTYAEVIAGSGKLTLARKPDDISFETAAAIPLAGATALDAVDAVGVGPGDIVVVAGATGGVGSISVQLAAQRGATVIATAKSGDEEAFVRSLGASETVDYATGDVAAAIRTRYPDGVTALIDGVDRDEAFRQMADLVGAGGRIATTLGAADVEGLAARGVRATNIMGTPTPDKLRQLAEQVAAGTLRIEIQQTFALADAARAFEIFGAGTRGKLVLTVG